MIGAVKVPFNERGGWWVLGQLGLMTLVIGLGVVFKGVPRRPGLTAAGAALMVAGGLTALAGTLALGRRLTPFPRPGENSDLVQGGIYGLVRHPLYCSVILASVGWGLFQNSWPSVVASAALALFLDAKARREERWLRDQFLEYPEYQARVRRFVPWVY